LYHRGEHERNISFETGYVNRYQLQPADGGRISKPHLLTSSL